MRPKTYIGLICVSALVVFALAAALAFTFRSKDLKGQSDKLGIRVEERADRIRLSWDRQAARRSGNGGVLYIDDGPQHRNVRLGAADLENGAVLYRPNTDDVSFRLEVRTSEGELMSGSIRVLDSAAVSSLSAAEPEFKQPAELLTHAPEITTMRVSEPKTRRKLPPMLSEDAKQVRTVAARNRTTADVSHPKVESPRRILEATARVIPRTGAPVEIARQPAADSKPASGAEPTGQSQPNSPPEQSPRAVQIAQAIPSTLSQPLSDAPRETMLPSPNAEVSKPEVVKPNLVKPGLPEPEREIVIPGTAGPALPMPPKPLRIVRPDLRAIGMAPNRSMQLKEEAAVEVAVKVNEKGNVTEAHLVDRGKNLPQFVAFAALVAAKQWTFQPAMLRGRKIASDYTIVFRFGPQGR